MGLRPSYELLNAVGRGVAWQVEEFKPQVRGGGWVGVCVCVWRGVGGGGGGGWGVCVCVCMCVCVCGQYNDIHGLQPAGGHPARPSWP